MTTMMMRRTCIHVAASECARRDRVTVGVFGPTRPLSDTRMPVHQSSTRVPIGVLYVRDKVDVVGGVAHPDERHLRRRWRCPVRPRKGMRSHASSAWLRCPTAGLPNAACGREREGHRRRRRRRRRVVRCPCVRHTNAAAGASTLSRIAGVPLAVERASHRLHPCSAAGASTVSPRCRVPVRCDRCHHRRWAHPAGWGCSSRHIGVRAVMGGMPVRCLVRAIGGRTEGPCWCDGALRSAGSIRCIDRIAS